MPTPDIEARLLHLSELVEVIIDMVGPVKVNELVEARRLERTKARVMQLENSWADGVKTGEAVKVKKLSSKSMMFGKYGNGQPMCGPVANLEPALQKAMKGKSVGTKVKAGDVSIVITSAYEPVEKSEAK